MKSVPEAIDEFVRSFPRVGTEVVHLPIAFRRWLAAPVHAQADFPDVDVSAMDGYAVRHTDTLASSVLRVAMMVQAGTMPTEPLPHGAACRIFTGAALPAGADSVVMQEDVDATDGTIALREPVRPRQHVRERASSVAAGQMIAEPGDPVTPALLALLASQNITELRVHRMPTVAVVSTGNELRALGDALAPGQVVNSNAIALEAMLRELGVQPVMIQAVNDDLPSVMDALHQASSCDAIVSTGGVSVGDFDVVQQAWNAVGVKIDFWKVALKPGKPLLFGHWNDVPVVGLPGNPVSALVIFEMFVAPALRRMMGANSPHPILGRATLAHAYKHRPGRLEFARAVVERSPEGLRVRLLADQSSGSLASMAQANALAVLSGATAEFSEGDEVPVVPWGGVWVQERADFV